MNCTLEVCWIHMPGWNKKTNQFKYLSEPPLCPTVPVKENKLSDPGIRPSSLLLEEFVATKSSLKSGSLPRSFMAQSSSHITLNY